MKLTRFCLAATLALLIAAFALPARHAARADEDMAAMVESAKTSADHEALAKMYDEEAKKAQALHEEHKQMAKSYAKIPRLSELSAHCKRLSQYYKSAAKEYQGMAVLEREQAKAPPE